MTRDLGPAQNGASARLDSDGGTAGPASRRSAARPGLLAALMAAPLGALIIAAGCRTEPDVRPLPPEPAQSAISSAFAGSAACAECHDSEFKRHHSSGHAATLQPAGIAASRAMPAVGAIPGTPYAIRSAAGKLRFELADDPATGGEIQYAMGSGKTAVTYIGEIGPDRLTEFRMSYDPTDRAWFVTPGQVGSADLNTGTVFERGMATRCVLCHADRLAPDSAGPASGGLGVGCESCHGPGRDHIAAARGGRLDPLHMERMESWSATRIDALCARCHRSMNDVALDQFDASNTARFQPYSLEQSPCFVKSGGKLSCVTCHDPHADVSTDQRAYERACLGCHSRAASEHATVCPVNPRDKCVGCHMPKRPIFPAAHVPLKISDHLIWAYKR
ncbi:MAG TPA: multiheme c-type cytochrome [Chthonomonadaceae bacterium]|nr:multiheme c-type cytochrome [Chthonomonadaceae bacterium]